MLLGMSTRVVSLTNDDVYADIYYEFFELYNEGHTVKDISSKLLAENKEIYNNPKDLNAGHNFWFALAMAQWECKQLDPDVLARVTNIITSDKNIAAWRDLGASQSDLKKRQAALVSFMRILRSEKPKPRLPRKKSALVHPAVYRKGDCLTFKFKNGHYGGAVVLEEVRGTRDTGSYNLIASTDIDLLDEPQLRDFKKANVIHRKHEDIDPVTAAPVWVDYPALYWASGSHFKDTNDHISIVGTIPVKKSYEVHHRNAEFMWGGSFNKSHIDQIEQLLASEKQDGKSHARTKLKKFTGFTLF